MPGWVERATEKGTEKGSHVLSWPQGLPGRAESTTRRKSDQPDEEGTRVRAAGRRALSTSCRLRPGHTRTDPTPSLEEPQSQQRGQSFPGGRTAWVSLVP